MLCVFTLPKAIFQYGTGSSIWVIHSYRCAFSCNELFTAHYNLLSVTKMIFSVFAMVKMLIWTFLAVQMPHVLFTGLEDYKARGTQSAPYFTVSYYNEFAESKDLVLIRGDVVFTSKISDTEAKWLLEMTQSFYLNDVRYKLVERFNKETHDFEFKDVLQALDMPILWSAKRMELANMMVEDKDLVSIGIEIT